MPFVLSPNPYQVLAAQTKPIVSGRMLFDVTQGTPTASYSNAGHTSLSHSGAGVASYCGTFNASAQNTGTLNILATGDVVEYVAWLTLTNFADLSANELLGLSFTSGTATPVFNTTDTTLSRVTIGANSSGDVYLVSSSGSAVTATDTTFNAVSGTRFKVKITWTKGTSVSVSIDDGTPTTISTNIGAMPMTNAWIGTGSSTGSLAKRVDHRGGDWMFTPVS